MATLPPKVSTASRMRPSSVATRISSTPSIREAASQTHWITGLPRSSARGFPGNLCAPYRAGITQMTGSSVFMFLRSALLEFGSVDEGDSRVFQGCIGELFRNPFHGYDVYYAFDTVCRKPTATRLNPHSGVFGPGSISICRSLPRERKNSETR